jgi:prepilin-type N-terminal cleavage/methylation domain-containing protein
MKRRDLASGSVVNKGFALIEVLIASILICLFAASFTFMVTAGIKQVAASKKLTRSIFVSKSMMEELRSKPFDSLYSYNNVSFDNGGGIIIVAPKGGGLVSITVRHKAVPAVRQVELNTLRSRF